MNHDYTQGPLLLLAGPGTGKTYSLLETIKTHVQKAFEHSDFFEATLTNAAANDFITDARREISPDFESSSTLHYRAKGILHNHAALANLNPDFAVIDDTCEKVILRDICYILGRPASNIGGELREYREASAKYLPIKSDFSRTYQKAQFFYAAVDWFDVVKLVCQLLEQHQQVRDKECNRFQFLLIDEYQDLNPAEQRFVELLLNGRTTLLAVGDDDQSIYGGRYACPRGIVSFDERYPNAAKKALPVTSRLPSRIIKPSDTLISRNTIREPKKRLIPLNRTEDRAGGGFVVSVNLKSGKAEQEFIRKAIAELLTQRIPPGDILVLCNCSALGLDLIKTIEDSEDQIPIRNDLEKDQDSDERKLLLRYICKFVSHQGDNLSLRIILHKLLETDPNGLSFLVKHSLEQEISLWKTINNRKVVGQLENTASVISDFVAVAKKAFEFDDFKERLNCILSAIPSLSDLLRLVQDEDEQSDEVGDKEESKEAKHAVGFMTIHNSKGLDADFVFIPFMEQSIGLPAVDTEEKRRLFYVAITRAKVGVTISWAWSRGTNKRFKCAGSGGGWKDRKPSSFITECGISPNLCSPHASTSASEIALRILSKHAARVHSFDKS